LAKLTFDTSDFEIKSMALVEKVKRASEEGMENAVKELMNDALTVSPMCPQETGAMAASHSVFVDGKLVKVSTVIPSGGVATPRTSSIFKVSKNIEGALVVNKPYAASQHEGVRKGRRYANYTLIQSGPKWIESKLVRFGKKYFSMIAKRVKTP
jgi:hypothetical protein